MSEIAASSLTARGHGVFQPETELLWRKILAVVPAWLFGLRLWASVCLALYVAFWLQLDNASWAGTSAAIVCQPQLGASLRKGWFRMIGTVVGAIMAVVLVACFPQDRILFLGGLAIWVALAALAATLLRNFASYAAALAGYTVAIISGDLLGATGGVSADAAFLLAVARASEIIIGIVCAGVVLAVTDFGGARRRLATLFAGLSSGIASQFAGTLTTDGPDLSDTTPVRREFIRQVIALEPAVDLALGESAQLRYHSPVLQRAVDGLFAALAGWRGVANHLLRLPPDLAHDEARLLWEDVPPELREPLSTADTARWISNPVHLRNNCVTDAGRLIDRPAASPSRRLLADKTAIVLTGIADALNGLALLVADPARSLPGGGLARLHVPDWLPALTNAGRAFVMVVVVALFWIVTAWPNGATVITFAAIVLALLSPRADEAYIAAIGLTLGCAISAIAAAAIEFALLPALSTESFAALAVGIGLYLVPVGVMMVRSRQPGVYAAMAANFLPILAPVNQMSYDNAQFYNQAMAIVLGAGVGAMSFRLLPPLSPALRTRRLLMLTLRDLRHLAGARWRTDWASRGYARLAVMPEKATPLQRAQLLAALSVGVEIERLRPLFQQLGLGADLANASTALASGDSASAVAGLLCLDQSLAERASNAPEVMHARAGILALIEVLSQHAAYFNAGSAR
jgi:uncharacterized membrane protein YccC